MPKLEYRDHFVPASAATKRQLEDAAKSLHARSAGDFREIYQFLFEQAVECGGVLRDPSRSKHPILSTVRPNESAIRSTPGTLSPMDGAITRICTDREFRTHVKASPVAALSTIGVSLSSEAEASLGAGPSDDPNLLISVARAQTTGSDELVGAPQEVGTVAIAIGVTIVLSGVGVAVVVIIRRRRRRSESPQIDDDLTSRRGGN